MENLNFFNMKYLVILSLLNGLFLVGGEVHSNCGQHGLVALTFDDGPVGEKTTEILDILDEYDVKATFFINGLYNHETDAGRYETTIKDIFNRGHQIGSHGWDHLDFTQLPSVDHMRSNLEQLASTIRNILGQNMTIFRPPLGETNEEFESIVANEFHYEMIMWNVDTNDWRHPGDTELGLDAYRTAFEFDTHLNTSLIGLHHDYLEGAGELLRATLDLLLGQNMTIVTVAECVGVDLHMPAPGDPSTTTPSQTTPEDPSSTTPSNGSNKIMSSMVAIIAFLASWLIFLNFSVQ